jgi:hypothetical protein
MATKQKSKARAQIAHARQRLFERYGIEASDAEIKGLVSEIQAGRGQCIERQSLRVTVWELLFHERRIRVVYDKERKTIATVLPPIDRSAPSPSGTGSSTSASSAKRDVRRGGAVDADED